MGSTTHVEEVPHTEQEVTAVAEEVLENANVVEHPTEDLNEANCDDVEEDEFEDFAEPEFKVGDVVYLKSGSPNLILLKPSTSPYFKDHWEVGWFTLADEYRTNNLPQVCLTHDCRAKF